MSTWVVGIKDPTPEYKAKLEAFHACKNAGIEIPAELITYFDGEMNPNPSGQEVSLPKEAKTYYQNSDHGEEGIIIEIAQLPEGITKIKFANDW